MPLRLKIFQVDAFTDTLFGGNPAAVCLLDQWLSTEQLQKIASENFLPETAFIVPLPQKGSYDIKWFTPEIEMDLCGHATLASAHVLFHHVNISSNEIHFNSNSGLLKVTKSDNLILLDFPSWMPAKTILPEIIEKGIGVTPIETWKARDYVLVYEQESIINTLKPNRNILDQIDLGTGGIIVTAKGKHVDFVSRFFTPGASIFEDPVTGSAHCSLIPLWSMKTGKKELIAEQRSSRLGKLFCQNLGDRVSIGGFAKTYLEGEIYLQ
jgi:PhzF family phenazine biosynthesis protein